MRLPSRHSLCPQVLLFASRSGLGVERNTKGSKDRLHQTKHPSPMPASEGFPGQHKNVVLRVCFTSARLVSPSVRDATATAMSRAVFRLPSITQGGLLRRALDEASHRVRQFQNSRQPDQIFLTWHGQITFPASQPFSWYLGRDCQLFLL